LFAFLFGFYSQQNLIIISTNTADMPEYNYIVNSKNVLNNSIYYVNIFKILPSFKICNGFAMRLYSEPFRHICRVHFVIVLYTVVG